jgi:hypothetical protein
MLPFLPYIFLLSHQTKSEHSWLVSEIMSFLPQLWIEQIMLCSSFALHRLLWIWKWLTLTANIGSVLRENLSHLEQKSERAVVSRSKTRSIEKRQKILGEFSGIREKTHQQRIFPVFSEKRWTKHWCKNLGRTYLNYLTRSSVSIILKCIVWN